jgi:hypothetical protein
MSIDPADTGPLKAVMPDEVDNIGVRERFGQWQLLVAIGQEPAAARGVADQKFTVDQFVAGDYIDFQQLGHARGIGLPVREKPDPDGCIDENHWVLF